VTPSRFSSDSVTILLQDDEFVSNCSQGPTQDPKDAGMHGLGNDEDWGNSMATMRVLVADQEPEMLEAIARAFEVDVATSKATCIDLLRANQFDVIVACERLSDGSGLELLSHVGQRWPKVIRILAIEPQRRAMLRGRLGPFKLFETLSYPIDDAKLEAALGRAAEQIAVNEAAEMNAGSPPNQGIDWSDAPASLGGRKPPVAQPVQPSRSASVPSAARSPVGAATPAQPTANGRIPQSGPTAWPPQSAQNGLPSQSAAGGRPTQPAQRGLPSQAAPSSRPFEAVPTARSSQPPTARPSQSGPPMHAAQSAPGPRPSPLGVVARDASRSSAQGSPAPGSRAPGSPASRPTSTPLKDPRSPAPRTAETPPARNTGNELSSSGPRSPGASFASKPKPETGYPPLPSKGSKIVPLGSPTAPDYKILPHNYQENMPGTLRSARDVPKKPTLQEKAAALASEAFSAVSKYMKPQAPEEPPQDRPPSKAPPDRKR
jgi:hypothetical protein